MSAEKAIRRPGPELQGVVAEAAEALARLDAGRLQELAVSCQALNRRWEGGCGHDREQIEREALAALGGMATLARVLEATRSNLKVMRRLQDVREGRIEYCAAGIAAAWPPGDRHGHD
ncbi:MAG: hypothetical protein ACLGP3_06645 [Acidobacteriota bacterium]